MKCRVVPGCNPTAVDIPEADIPETTVPPAGTEAPSETDNDSDQDPG